MLSCRNKAVKKKKCVSKNVVNFICKPNGKTFRSKKKSSKRIIKRVTTRPQINVEPANINIPAPIVNVQSDVYSCLVQLRADLQRFIGQEIEIIDSAGAGAGGEASNRIGRLEAVGEGTVALRPTNGNLSNQIIYYSLLQIIGFRPLVTLNNPVPIGL